jgi:hypothetical protein
LKRFASTERANPQQQIERVITLPRPKRHRVADVTSRLNKLYLWEDSGLDERLGEMQRKSLHKEGR